MKDLAEIVKFSDETYKNLGEDARNMIMEDAAVGIMQDGKSNLKYYSRDYVEKKSAGMAAPYQISMQTDFVDMTLTGDMWSRLKVSVNGNSVILKYDPADTKKITYNKRFGRVIDRLRDENVSKLTKELNDVISKNINQLNINEKLYLNL